MQGIQWNEWEQAAFEKARKENKPILLDIFGTWCHWCHRMDQDTYEHPEVVEKISHGFVPVRVDTDKRPDINDRYNQGGWPSTVFLDEEGLVITGATYLPPEQMLRLLDQVARAFRNGRRGQRPQPFPRRRGAVTGQILLQLEDLIKGHFDPVHGGFGEPKFPMPELLEFLLERCEETKQKVFLDMVEKTLEWMRGGIFDREEGGFFRYSVTLDWKLPHYEKMLETNAGLVRVLSHFYGITKKENYLEVLKKTVSYLLQTLSDKGGVFYASQDADGEEAYYGRPLKERKQLNPPRVDRAVYADLNGEAVRALLAYHQAVPDKRAAGFAEKVLHRLGETFLAEGTVAHYIEREPIFLGLLRDHISVGLALAEAGRILGKKAYLQQADMIAGQIVKRFHDPEGGFWDTLGLGEGKLKIREKQLQQNARAALLFLELGRQLDKPAYLALAEEALELFALDWQAHGILAAEYGLAVGRLLQGKT